MANIEQINAPNPVLRSTSVAEITSRISRAESLDLKSATFDEIEAVINDCMKGYTCPRFPLVMLGIGSLFRAVRSQNRPVERVEDIRYPPPKYVRNYGRANGPGRSVFYAATDRDTALLEMRPDIGGRLVLSQWEPLGGALPQVREMGLLETVGRLRPDLATTLRNELEPSRKQGLSVEDLDKQSRIRAFLARQFTKVVSTGSEHDHRLSARIAETLMEGETDGVVYASIATARSGVNVALRPNSLDRLYKPLSCCEIKVEERIEEYKYKVKVLRRSERIASNGSIAWG